MEIKIIKDLKEMIALEQLRTNAVGVFDIVVDENDRLVTEMKNGIILPFAVYINSELVGGCYITNARNSIYFDFLFVKEEYRNKGIGKKICIYILENKEIVEDYFKQKFDYSYSDPANLYSKKIFTELGYKGSNNILGEWKTRIRR